MTGVTRHTGFGHVLLPFGVDEARHLQHASRHHFGVERVVGEVGRVVTVGAALFRGDPVGHGDHQAGELTTAQVAQHLDVFVADFVLGR